MNHYPLRPLITFTVMTLIHTLVSMPSALADENDRLGRRWNDSNDPAQMDPRYHYSFDRLPLSGEMDLSKRGWSDTYWPLQNGMITWRWQETESNFKKDESPSYGDVANWSEHQIDKIDKLSPAEKFDLARFDGASELEYSLTKKIRKSNSGLEKEWRGICNGWTQASLNFDEPKPFVYTNEKAGIRIPFGSSDVKALLAYYYAKEDNSRAVIVGERCRLPGAMSWMSPSCADLNAGAFHIIMTNELGLKHQGFAGDRDASSQVWNQPFVKFSSRIEKVLDRMKGDKLSKKANSTTIREITVSSEVTYVEEIQPTYQAVIGAFDDKGSPLNTLVTVTYRYLLEVDYYGNVIGGEWLDGPHPDFLWKQEFNPPTGDFEFIQTLYEKSIGTK